MNNVNKLLNESQRESLEKIHAHTTSTSNQLEIVSDQATILDVQVLKSKAVQSKDSQLKSHIKENSSVKTKKQQQKTKSEAQTKNNEKEDETKSTSSPFSFFYSMMPKDFLGVSLSEIKNDLKEGTIQLTSAYVFKAIYICFAGIFFNFVHFFCSIFCAFCRVRLFVFLN